MIKTKVSFLEGRLLSSQSEQFEKYSKSSDRLEKSHFWSCKQAISGLAFTHIEDLGRDEYLCRWSY